MTATNLSHGPGEAEAHEDARFFPCGEHPPGPGPQCREELTVAVSVW